MNSKDYEDFQVNLFFINSIKIRINTSKLPFDISSYLNGQSDNRRSLAEAQGFEIPEKELFGRIFLRRIPS